MERLFRSLKSEWIPETWYRSLTETKMDIGRYYSGLNKSHIKRIGSYTTNCFFKGFLICRQG